MPDAWLRLALAPGVGNTSLIRLLTAFGSPEAVLASGRSALTAHLSRAQCDALLAESDAVQLDAAHAWLAQPGNSLMTLADEDYPKTLLEIADPPAILYCKGRRSLLNQPCLGIVGSRNATPQGVRDAEAFAHALSDAGLTIVSGLALGIDAAAHRGGLAGAGSSVAIIGTGLDRIYPARNKALAHRLAENGLIVSEFALGTPPLPGHFPRRNRLISGLSRGVLVVEAAPNSGSLITARVATEQGREVFAIPGSIHSPLARGCHALIKQGAKLVESAADILDELAWQQRLAPPVLREDRPQGEHPEGHECLAAAYPSRALPETLSDPVLDALDGAPTTPDTLAQRTGLTLDALSAKLLTLELDGRIASLPGGRYQKIH
ncbi:DNA-processing protein DprA [Thiobacillus denitrificans]|uniref:DNA-binding protein n=1 Tax=Thiobacillus denitrificans TaxID=36861 RepID=A0A106BN35_THIDE|nr:DNA-processing protein DprA [Thiobacillus denitrificans]KVW95516.1 DNA-binding protein [Thiobacillus denitrificans]